MEFRSNIPPICNALLFSLLVMTASPQMAHAVNEVSDKDIEALDGKFQRFSADFYSTLSRRRVFNLPTIKDMESLDKQTQAYVQKGKHVFAILLISQNLPTIRTNIDDRRVFKLVALLLKHNEWHLATKLFDLVKDDDNSIYVSNVAFIFAQYYLKRKNWQKVLDLLTNAASDLPADDYHHALLMQGIALQHLKKHRLAIPLYEKIPATSRYYSAAVLNTAVAYIRQDWWTDAHNAINKLVKNEKQNTPEEITNRLYLVLGYSLLRKEYFRNSRDAFRSISKNSIYTNKALMGIALTAANQEDYIGALNAITILKDKKSFDLSVDESHLLLPYIYGKLKQNLTASAGFTAAIKYYKDRINKIKNIEISQSKNYDVIKISKNSSITVGENSINFTQGYPQSFLDNYTELGHFDSFLRKYSDEKLSAEFNKFHHDYRVILMNTIRKQLDLRVQYLESYINQARYALASLFDNTPVGNQ